MDLILVADIGGTNSRFGLFENRMGQEARLVSAYQLPTAGANSFAELLDQLEQEWMSVCQMPTAQVVLAVAGPIQGRRCQLTNAAWAIDLDFCPGLPQTQITLINDFVAQALGCLTPVVRSSAVLLQTGTPQIGPKAAMGAGTGLGACALALWPHKDNCFVPLASEAGHVSMVFQSAQERALADFIAAEHQVTQVVGDVVVSGRGLCSIHRFLTGRDLDPAGVAAEIGPDSETTAWFARFYGRACRMYALHVLPWGGFFLCGGLAAKNPFLVTHPEFLCEFTDSPTYGSMLAEIPIQLVTHPEAGLYGAAQYGRLSACV